jgi:hypothetical protein
MTEKDAVRPDLALVLGRFPQVTLLIRQRFMADQGFRGLCEDYALARETLARFRTMPNAEQRPEIAEYVAIIADLENEIIVVVRDAGGYIEVKDEQQ